MTQSTPSRTRSTSRSLSPICSVMSGIAGEKLRQRGQKQGPRQVARHVYPNGAGDAPRRCGWPPQGPPEWTRSADNTASPPPSAVRAGWCAVAAAPRDCLQRLNSRGRLAGNPRSAAAALNEPRSTMRTNRVRVSSLSMTLFQLAKLSCRPTRSYRRHSGPIIAHVFSREKRGKHEQ
jgi:hypothetical protein